jgi:hypothetical protein
LTVGNIACLAVTGDIHVLVGEASFDLGTGSVDDGESCSALDAGSGRIHLQTLN